MFNFYLNNNLVNDPINWDDFTETIERDEIIKGLLPKYEVKLTFNGGGYAYLYNLKQSNGFCNLVELRIESNKAGVLNTELNGYIFISDCKFNLNKKTVECDVIDNNFGARIYNNKSIEIYLDSTLTKNNATLYPSGARNVTFFNPSSGTDVAGYRKVYPVWECFKYFISFMSDGLIDFESNFLDLTLTQTDNPQRKLTITTGAILRGLTGSPSPKTSFGTLFQEVNKKYPIAFTVLTQTNGRPLIKIENEDYFYGSDSGIKIEDIEDIEQSINNRLLYSEIGIGGTTVDYNAAIHSMPDIRMMFKEESYYFQTECNIDNKLDLVNTYICDSNIIEELVDTNTTNDIYDKSIFFIECSYNGGIVGNLAIKTSLYDSSVTPYYYNAGLTNTAISQNFNLYADLVQYINSNDIGFMATKNVNAVSPYHRNADYTVGFGGILNPLSSSTDLIQYQDDFALPNHDTAGNYSSGRYTAPNDGHYYFKSNLKLKVETDIPAVLPGALPGTGNPNIMIRFYLFLRKYSSGGVLLDTYAVSVGLTDFDTYKVFIHPNMTFTMGGEKMYFLEAGEYVETYFRWESLPYKHYSSSGHYLGDPTCGRVVILAGSDTYFKTLTTEGNGSLTSGTSLGYNVQKLEFERPIPDDVYKILKQDLSRSMTVNHDGKSNKTAWIRKTVRKVKTGETKLELISNETNMN